MRLFLSNFYQWFLELLEPSSPVDAAHTRITNLERCVELLEGAVNTGMTNLEARVELLEDALTNRFKAESLASIRADFERAREYTQERRRKIEGRLGALEAEAAVLEGRVEALLSTVPTFLK